MYSWVELRWFNLFCNHDEYTNGKLNNAYSRMHILDNDRILRFKKAFLLKLIVIALYSGPLRACTISSLWSSPWLGCQFNNLTNRPINLTVTVWNEVADKFRMVICHSPIIKSVWFDVFSFSNLAMGIGQRRLLTLIGTQFWLLIMIK